MSEYRLLAEWDDGVRVWRPSCPEHRWRASATWPSRALAGLAARRLHPHEEDAAGSGDGTAAGPTGRARVAARGTAAARPGTAARALWLPRGQRWRTWHTD